MSFPRHDADSDWYTWLKVDQNWIFKTNEWPKAWRKTERKVVRTMTATTQKFVLLFLFYISFGLHVECGTEWDSDRLAALPNLKLFITKPHKWNVKLIVFVPTDLPVATNSNNNNMVSRRDTNFIIIILSNVESVGRPPSPQRTIRSHCRHARELINCRAPDSNSDHTGPNTFSRLMKPCTMCSGFTMPKKFDLAILIPNRIVCVFIALGSASLETFHSPLWD